MDGSAHKDTEETSLARLGNRIAQLEAIIETWAGDTRDTVHSYRASIDALHAEALRRMLRSLRDAGAVGSLREAARDEVVYAVLRHHGLVKPSIAERVEAALESVRPLLATHGGNVELVDVEPPRASVRFTGACDNCPASTLTISAAVKTAVQAACAEITEIVQVRLRDNRPELTTASTETAWLPAGLLTDIPDGGLRAMEFPDLAVLLFRRQDEIRCFEDACAHLGTALHNGAISDGKLTCRQHGFRFDLGTGACETMPGLMLRAFESQVVDGRILIRLD